MLIFTRHPRTFTNDFWDLPENLREKHTHWYGPDARITKIGRQQAIKMSYAFKQWLESTGIQISGVAISPSSRTLEYADILLPVIGCNAPVFVEPLIREKVKAGCVSNVGLPRDRLKEKIDEEGWLKGFQIDFSKAEDDWIHGEETDDAFDKRIQKARKLYLGEALPEKTAILAISHWLYGNLFLERPDCIHNCEFIFCSNNGGRIETKSILSPVSTAGNPQFNLQL